MAFTNYKTWSAGETLTAANFNAQIRDNGLSMGPHLIVRKTADQSVTSSTTLVNDTALVLPLVANEIWHFRFFVVVGGDQNADFSVGFTFPTGGDLRMSVFYFNESATAFVATYSTTTSPSAREDFNLAGAAAYATIPFEGVFVNGANAGSLTLQWAQQTSNGTPTTVKANSTLWAVKLA